MHFHFDNVNDAFWGMVRRFSLSGLERHQINPLFIETTSRNGPVIQYAEPATITYRKPLERVLFNSARDANPFFHIYEALWMLAGRSDVEPLVYYNSRMAQFSDDGLTFNGAYGYRWRHAYNRSYEYDDFDQLPALITHLKVKPDSRRAVLQMWNVEDDLQVIDTSKDVSCNLCVMFMINLGKLDMTVMNRSNDMCLAPETKFRSPEGDTSISELAKKFQTEKSFKFPVYSVDTKTGDQRLSWMTNAWKSGVKRLLKIGFDDGSFIRVSGNHILFKKRRIHEGKKCIGLSLEEIPASELRVGDRVLAELSEKSGWRSGKYLYSKRSLFKNTSYENRRLEHREYWEFVTGENPGEDDIHHKDENGRNNQFDNLQRISKAEHVSYHASKDPPYHKKPEAQKFKFASLGGKSKKGKPFTMEHRMALSEGRKNSELVKNRKRGVDGRYISNHKIISIEADRVEDVYDFTVPGRHNAVLANGVVVHNCLGMFGANLVHFSILHEYVAAGVGVPVGVYNQISNNLHVYLSNFKPNVWLTAKDDPYPYSTTLYQQTYKPTPLVQDPVAFDKELYEFVQRHSRDSLSGVYSEPFLQHVAQPMCVAFHCHKRREYTDALNAVESVASADWRKVGKEWITRRKLAWEKRSASSS